MLVLSALSHFIMRRITGSWSTSLSVGSYQFARDDLRLLRPAQGLGAKRPWVDSVHFGEALPVRDCRRRSRRTGPDHRDEPFAFPERPSGPLIQTDAHPGLFPRRMRRVHVAPAFITSDRPSIDRE